MDNIIYGNLEYYSGQCKLSNSKVSKSNILNSTKKLISDRRNYNMGLLDNDFITISERERLRIKGYSLSEFRAWLKYKKIKQRKKIFNVDL